MPGTNETQCRRSPSARAKPVGHALRPSAIDDSIDEVLLLLLLLQFRARAYAWVLVGESKLQLEIAMIEPPRIRK